MMTRKYYLAYGMNTNRQQMAQRCPAAISLGAVKLVDYKLAFRTFCDVVPSVGHQMDCALWSITDHCEQALDRLEGFPDFYGKKEVSVIYKSKPIMAMIYYMKDLYKQSLPSANYLNLVTEGYMHHNMSVEQIYTAIDEVSNHEHYTW
jgi:hypothetical protein